jgi:hypothetical protein
MEKVELYLDPEDLMNDAKFDRGSAGATIITNDGAFPYIRYSNPTPGDKNHLQYSIIPAGNEAVTGRYLVMKYRYQRENSARFLLTYAHTKDSTTDWWLGGQDDKGGIRCQMPNYTAEKVAQWHVMVIDLAQMHKTYALLEKENAAFTPNEDGEYVADIIYLRLFGDDWSGNCTTLTKETDFIDFAYIAMVDDLSDLKEFVAEDKYIFGLDTNGYHFHDTFTTSCVSMPWGEKTQTWTTTETTHATDGYANCGTPAIAEEPHTYGNVGGVRKCTVCGYVNAELYLSPETLSGKYTTNTDFSASYVTDDGDTPYFHIERLTTTSRPQISLISSSNTKETGQYLIIKYRGKNSVTDDPNGIVLYANTTETSGDRNFNAALTYDEDWHVLVCDLSKVNPNHSDPTKVPYDKYVANKDGMYVATKLNIRVLGGGWSGDGTWDGTLNKSVLNGQKEGDYIDIAYIAMVNSLDDIRDIVSEETIDWRTGSVKNESRDTATLTETVAE